MNKHHTRRWLCVAAYAAAMAWVEAAVVFHLRRMVNRIEPYQAMPFPEFGGIGPAAMVREFTTLIMLQLPQQFNRPHFHVALLLMAAPVVEVWRRIRSAATGAVPAVQCN